jgi:hypothetical protein
VPPSPVSIHVVIDSPSADLLITVALAFLLWVLKPEDVRAWIRHRVRRTRTVSLPGFFLTESLGTARAAGVPPTRTATGVGG